MSISEADLDLFMSGIARLFTPWFPSPKTDKILRTDEAGNPLYWEDRHPGGDHKVEIPVGVVTAPLHGLADRSGGGSTE